MNLRFVLVPFALLAASVTQAQPDPILSAPMQPLSPSKRGVVFQSKLAREFARQCSRSSPSGWWTSVSPSQNEIKRLERALPGWMKTHQVKPWSGRFNDYFYQYGALARGKTRLIYINAVPARSEQLGAPKFRQMWRRVPEVVCDGGPDFWGVEFNPATNAFQNASFNGMA